MIALVRLDYLESGQGEDIVLPEKRNALYEKAVALFVNQWQESFEWDEARGLGINKPEQSKVLIKLLEQAALLLQKGQSSATEEPSQMDRGYLITHLDKALTELDADTIERCLQYSHERTLLLVEQKLDSWGFQHKTFQEYLSAEAIIHDLGNLDILVDHLGEDHWRVVFDLLVEGQTQDGGRPNAVLEEFLRRAGQRVAEDSALAGRGWYWLEGLYEREAFHYPVPERNRLQHNAWQGLTRTDGPLVLAKFHNFAAKGLPAVGLNEMRFLQRLDEVEENQQHLIHHILLLPEVFPQSGRALRQRLEIYLDDTLPATARGAAALTLKHLGDVELEVLNRHLFVPIAAAEFCRGSLPGEKDARDDEIDGGKYWLDAFEIARFPVTNAEYLRFMLEKKHKAPYSFKEGEYPQGQGNHPVVGVNWYDAQAYVVWLNEFEDHHRYFLPTEVQWERTARGPALSQGRENRRRYPWGDEFDPQKCNVYETGLGRTTAVGCFVDGASPEEVLDMAGNVWEWCADGYDEKYY
ncbi:MAG: SUMF1/EgtB/PvdO family nonheme iron enzyme, partial [Gammaproteobacteria bacterium]|nr:SUMF1/EgtB/PvdO family nonheme iron enzyme [Gammaproteobacteria bacterium]